MLLRTLGGLRLEGAAFGRPKPLLLLAYLAMEGPRDRRFLSRLFWPAAPAPMTNLRTALSQLNKGAPGAVRSDAARLSTALEVDAKAVLDGASFRLEGELEDVYPGPFLEGVHLPDWGAELEEWVFSTRELVAETVRSQVLDHAEELARRGQAQLAARRAEQAYRLPGAPEPTPETLDRAYALMVAGGNAYAAKLRAEALEYGIALTEPVRDVPTLPAAKLGGRAPHNLRHRTTSFEGRDLELLELARLLGDQAVRLVTLLGPGGTGKTSLALAAAQQELEAGTFSGGVYLVSLEDVSGRPELPSAIAGALGLEFDGDGTTALAELIADPDILLVLDNCEHLVGQLGLVTDLLSHCAGLTVLAASRERLHLPGEQLFPVDGLPFPDPEEQIAPDARYLDSVRLFEKRAKRVDLGFVLDEQNLSYVAKICAAVEGSPLAIELAAALVGVLTPEEIAAELTEDHDVLNAPSLAVPDRHRSLRATFEHSWSLLSPSEHAALAALAIFAGGFSREAASHVADLTIPMLSALIDKSLVRALGSGRYGLHPLVRGFALEKLELSPERAARVKKAHAEHLIQLAAEPSSRTLDTEKVYAERENFRAALARSAREGDWDTAVRLIAAVWPVWHDRGDWREARAWLERAVHGYETSHQPDERAPGVDGDPRLERALAEAHRGLAVMAANQGDLSLAEAQTRASLELSERLGDRERVGAMTNHLGVIALHRGDYGTAKTLFTEALAIRRELDDREGVAATLNNLGAMAGRAEDIEAAERYYAASLAIFRELGHRRAIALLLSNLGDVAEYMGDFAKAEGLYEESLEIHEEINSKAGVATCLARLAAAARRRGDLARAGTLCLEALEGLYDLHDLEAMGECLNELGLILSAANRHEPAATAWGAMESLLDSAGSTLTGAQSREHQEAVSSARAAMRPESFRRAWEAGARFSPDEALSFASRVALPAPAGERS